MSDLSAGIRLHHWIAALGGALLLHAGLVLFFARAEPAGAAAAGFGGIAVDLGTAGGSPGEAVAAEFAEEANQASSVPEAETVDPQSVTEAVTESVPAQTVAQVAEVTAAAPVETVAQPVPAEVVPAEVPLYAPEEPEVAEVAEATVQPVETVAEPTVTAEAAAQAVEPAPVHEAMATPALPPRKPERKVAEPQQVAALPQPAAEVVAPADGEVTAASRGSQVGEPNPDAAVGSGGKAGKGDTAATGMDSGREAGGIPGSSADYKALLHAWLEKHKEYPRRAKLRRQEGRAYLYFVIDGAGQLLEFRVKESSGYKLLDEEVLEMVKRAAPLPPVPGGAQDGRFVYDMPIDFELH